MMRAMSSTTTFSSYEEAVAQHRWEVPERYNIAADVCDKHPHDKPALVWESFDGSSRELVWGELQDLANRAAHTLAAHGVDRGDRVAVVLPATPETAAVFFGVWKLGAILLSLSVLYGDDAIRHRLDDSSAKVLVTDEANAGRFESPDPVLARGDHNYLRRPPTGRQLFTLVEAPNNSSVVSCFGSTPANRAEPYRHRGSESMAWMAGERLCSTGLPTTAYRSVMVLLSKSFPAPRRA